MNLYFFLKTTYFYELTVVISMATRAVRWRLAALYDVKQLFLKTENVPFITSSFFVFTHVDN